MSHLTFDADISCKWSGDTIFRRPNTYSMSQRCTYVDIDQNLVLDPTPSENPGIRGSVVGHMDYVASWTGTNIFLLRPKSLDIETASFTGTLDNSLDQRFKIAIFGDMESSEHAKTRILIMIDQIVSSIKRDSLVQLTDLGSAQTQS